MSADQCDKFHGLIMDVIEYLVRKNGDVELCCSTRLIGLGSPFCYHMPVVVIPLNAIISIQAEELSNIFHQRGSGLAPQARRDVT